MTLVCQDLELIEKEYFSLTYRDANNMKVNNFYAKKKKIKQTKKQQKMNMNIFAYLSFGWTTIKK